MKPQDETEEKEDFDGTITLHSKEVSFISIQKSNRIPDSLYSVSMDWARYTKEYDFETCNNVFTKKCYIKLHQ